MAVEGYDSGFDRKHALGPDIVEELQSLEAVDADDSLDEWAPLFDPESFTQAHQPLSLDRYRLSEEELKAWAQRLVRLRAEIDQRAKRLVDVEPAAEMDAVIPRSRKGQKRSTAAHNVEGLKEEELRELRIIDRVPCRKFKKRHLKDLTEEEVDEIIN